MIAIVRRCIDLPNYNYCVVYFSLQNLLRHPLCLALVRRKWNKYGRYLYYMGLLRYSTFLAFLTSFALLTPNARTRLENGGNNINGAQFCQDSDDDSNQEKSQYLYPCAVGILVLTTYNCLMEFVQLYRV